MPLTKSKQPRKQRLARYQAPKHRARKLIAAHLANDLLLRYNRRSMTVITGDTVKVLRGSHKGHTGKVANVDVSRRRIIVEGVTGLKADGTKVERPIDASNVIITRLNLADPRRRNRLAEGVKGSAEEKKKALAEMEAAGQEDAKAAEQARLKEAEEREKARAEREAAEEHDHDEEEEK